MVSIYLFVLLCPHTHLKMWSEWRIFNFGAYILLNEIYIWVNGVPYSRGVCNMFSNINVRVCLSISTETITVHLCLLAKFCISIICCARLCISLKYHVSAGNLFYQSNSFWSTVETPDDDGCLFPPHKVCRLLGQDTARLQLNLFGSFDGFFFILDRSGAFGHYLSS